VHADGGRAGWGGDPAFSPGGRREPRPRPSPSPSPPPGADLGGHVTRPGGRWGRRARRADAAATGQAGPERSRPRAWRGSRRARPPPRPARAHARSAARPSLRAGTPGGRQEDMASDAVQVGVPASAPAGRSPGIPTTPHPPARALPGTLSSLDPSGEGGDLLLSAPGVAPRSLGRDREGGNQRRPLLGRWRFGPATKSRGAVPDPQPPPFPEN
jgi:hypothetical protein